MRLVLLAAYAWPLVIPVVAAQSPADPGSLEWSPPTTLPLGALAAVASGDPSGPVAPCRAGPALDLA